MAKPIEIRIVSPIPLPPPPPPPTKKEQREAAVVAQLAKEEADREARYLKNVNQVKTATTIIEGKKSKLQEAHLKADKKPIPQNETPEEKTERERLAELDQVNQLGNGVADDGMMENEIEDVMKKHPAFKGVIASDEISSIKPAKEIGVVQNLDDSSQGGSHWISWYISTDPKDRSVEYYDPFGTPPTAKWRKDIKMLVNKIKPDTMLKVKVNQVQHQDYSTSTCGLHALNFLKKRFAGQSFKMATGYSEGGKKDQSKRYENEIADKFSSLM